MKNLFTKCSIVLFVFAMLSIQMASANTSVTTVDDEAEIYSSFSNLEEVASFVSNNENATFSDLVAANISTEMISSSAAIAGNLTNAAAEPPLVSAFWWGCLTGPIGIVVVAVTTETDKEQIKKAAFGCAIPVGCSALSYIAYAIYAAVIYASY
jgi:hypothetical protein